MNKILKCVCFCLVGMFLVGCLVHQKPIANMINPWSDCGDDLAKASKIAGFKFPLVLSNYNVRAMDTMIEVAYPLDEFRDVHVRKSNVDVDNGNNSGVYNDSYTINKPLNIEDNTQIGSEGKDGKIFVIYFSVGKYYYSGYAKDGMSEQEAIGVFNVIRETENFKLERVKY